MSEVISFRLDQDNPREARAREVLRAWYAQGFSVRHILTEALLALEDSKAQDEETTFALDEVNRALHQVIQMLERMQNGRYVAAATGDDGQQPKAALTDTFVASVKSAARPGMKLNG
jgi:hypothetical protein